MAARSQPLRQVKRTALLVGEGLAEETFLRHLRSIYLERGSKSVKIKNAKGKGGKRVLEYTLSQRKAADYAEEAALLDTDTDWDDQQRAIARQHGVEIFEATPCLEALLLGIVAQPVPRTTKACKQAFKKHFGAEAHDTRLYETHFGQAVLDTARRRLPLLDRLISFVG